jgi:hypothetical protein
VSQDNVVTLEISDGRNESWNLPDGTVVTITVPDSEPPITVKHAVYCLSAVLHQTHRAMEGKL